MIILIPVGTRRRRTRNLSTTINRTTPISVTCICISSKNNNRASFNRTTNMNRKPRSHNLLIGRLNEKNYLGSTPAAVDVGSDLKVKQAIGDVEEGDGRISRRSGSPASSREGVFQKHDMTPTPCRDMRGCRLQRPALPHRWHVGGRMGKMRRRCSAARLARGKNLVTKITSTI